MKRSLSLAAATALVLAASPARAQLIVDPSDDMVRQAAQATRANISLGRYADGRSVAPETADEMAQPIVPFEIERQTVRRGVLTGEMQACGMDWLGVSFQPYMARIRAGDRLSQKQIVFIGMLHGFAQGQVSAALEGQNYACEKVRMKQLAVLASDPLTVP